MAIIVDRDFPDELHWELKAEAVRRRTTMKAAMRAVIAEALGTTATESDKEGKVSKHSKHSEHTSDSAARK